jgi:hypothetical protein
MFFCPSILRPYPSDSYVVTFCLFYDYFLVSKTKNPLILSYSKNIIIFRPFNKTSLYFRIIQNQTYTVQQHAVI